MINTCLKTLKYFVIFIFVTLILIWLLSPQIAKHYIQQQLTPQALTLAGQSHVRYNPFLSKINVENFVISKNKDIVLAIRKLELGVSLYQLLFDRVYIKQFDLNGLFIKVRKDGKFEEVAGFSLASKATKTANEQASPINYELIIPLLSIKNAKIGYENNDKKLDFIASYLSTKNIVADSKKQSGQFQLNAKIAQGKINISGDINKVADQGTIETNIEMSRFDLSLLSPWLPHNSQIASGLIDINGQQKTNLFGGKIEVMLNNSQVRLEQLALVHNNIAASIDKQVFYAKELALKINNDKTLSVNGSGTYTLDHLAVNNNENKQLLLTSVRKISLPTITIETTGFSPTLTLPSVLINKLIVSDDLTTELPPILRIDQTKFSAVKASKLNTEIDTLTFGGLAIDTYINATKEIENLLPLQLFIASNNATDANKHISNNPSIPNTNVSNSTTSPATSDYQFILNQLSVSDPATINLVDASIKPFYQRKYTIDKFELGPINNHLPHQETTLSIAGQSNKYENFNLTSVNQFFAKKPKYSVKGNINEIDLTDVSPYVSSALKHEIKSGQLNLTIDTQIDNDELSGNTDLLIRHIEFDTKIASAPGVVNTTASMPLNVALDLLKDSDGNVDLSIPISGDINAPEFGLINITTFLVKKASMMAAKDYLMKTFVPYANVVSIAMSAADAILKVRFNDLFFVPKQIQTSVTEDTFVAQFAQLLIDKPDTHVTICPIAVPEDINLKNGTAVTEPEQIEQLNAVSLQRFNSFKTLMIKQHNIPSSRIILCTPSIDTSNNAKPRLSFST